MASVLEQYLSRKCLCGNGKQSSRSFCLVCYRALSEEMRRALWQRFGHGYEQAYKAACDWLAANQDARENTKKTLPKLKWPVTSTQTLTDAGYECEGESRCTGCGELIEWWITPIGKKMPVTVRKAENVLFNSGDVREAHFATCIAADQFRKK